MKLILKKPVAIYQQGNQPVNEDFLFPESKDARKDTRLFVLCDGQSGNNRSDNGHTAAQLVGMGIQKYFQTLPEESDIDRDYLEQALRKAQDSLAYFLDENPEARGIATSLAMVHFGHTQATMAWIGKACVHYYNHELQTLTSSSTLEMDLDHPRPEAVVDGSDRSVSFRHKFIPYDDIRPGDYFVLSSSGMEQELDGGLKSVLKSSDEASPEALLSEIANLIVDDLATDNYACYLLPVERIVKEDEVVPSAATPISESSGVKDQDDQPVGYVISEETRRSSKFITWAFSAAAVLAVLITIAGIYFNQQNTPYDTLVTQANEAFSTARNASLDKDFPVANENFREAQRLFDSARVYARSPEQHIQLDTLQTQVRNFLNMTVNATQLEEVPMEDLTMSPSQYIKDGDAFFAENNYLEALQAYFNASRKLSALNADLSVIPRERMAEAYMRVGNDLYSLPDRPCEQIITYYQRALTMYQPEDSLVAPTWYEEASGHLDDCQLLLAEQRRADSLQQLQNVPSQTELLADNTSGAEPESSEATTTDGSTPASNRRVASPGTSITPTTTDSRANQRTRGDEGPAATNVSSSQLAAMRKALAEGKRQYIEAKERNSAFLYRTSAEKLAAAGSELDGSGAYLLAYMYHLGLGVTQDESKALVYAQQAARKNWAAGQYLYAHLLLERKNPRDTTTAVNSLRRAAGQYYGDAVKRLQELGMQ